MVIQVSFLGYPCLVRFGQYRNGRCAIQLEMDDGEPFCTASVNVQEEIGENEIAIKNYSENQGILDVLIEAGIVGQPTRYIRSGFVEIPVVPLRVNPADCQ